MNQKKRLIINREGWFLIGAGWLATQLIFLSVYGINDQQEAIKYISAAREFVNGSRNFSLHNLWYCGYIALHVLIRMAGLPPKCMYLFQVILSALSVYYFIKILSLWASSQKTLILSALLYSTCFIVQQWVSYLYTDSIFSMLLIIAIYYLLVEDRRHSDKIIFWFLIIILPFFRPVGFLFSFTACLHWTFTSYKKNIIKILICITFLVFISLLIIKSIIESPGYFYPFHNLNANVICGLPSNLLQYQSVPYHQNMSIANYFWNNPGLAIRLFTYRFYKVFSMTRPYFSIIHNLCLTIACLFYYSLATVGLFSIIVKRLKQQYLLFTGCLIFSVPSIVFCVEWSGRFSLPVICFILLLGGVGIDQLNLKFSGRYG